jgi:hypothetical protein
VNLNHAENDIEITHWAGYFLTVHCRVGKNPSLVEENTPLIDFS